MMQYLGVIEQRCNELMHSFSLKASQHHEGKAEGGRHASSTRGGEASAALSVGAGPQAPAGSTVINIEPPAIGDDNNSAPPASAPARFNLCAQAFALQVTTNRTTTRRGP